MSKQETNVDGTQPVTPLLSIDKSIGSAIQGDQQLSASISTDSPSGIAHPLPFGSINWQGGTASPSQSSNHAHIQPNMNQTIRELTSTQPLCGSSNSNNLLNEILSGKQSVLPCNNSPQNFSFLQSNQQQTSPAPLFPHLNNTSNQSSFPYSNQASQAPSSTLYISTGKSSIFSAPPSTSSSPFASILEPYNKGGVLDVLKLNLSGSPPAFATLQIDTGSPQLAQNLSKRISDLENKLHAAQTEKAKIQEIHKELMRTHELRYLSSRISTEAQEALVTCNALEQAFDTRACKAFVLSVDIRSSTTLMLKARSPIAFAQFVDQLIIEFKRAITLNHGVYDKFTGDGVLAFFPDFFTGDNAAYYAIKAAISCHNAFQCVYAASRTLFKSVPVDAGLGIGLDFGDVQLLRMAEGLTVVGEPVVYACRLGGAPTGKTLVNQPAYEEAISKCGTAFYFTETEHEFKHEGPQLAYSVIASPIEIEPPPVGWKKFLIQQELASEKKEEVVPPKTNNEKECVVDKA